jgi:hypothetical protein
MDLQERLLFLMREMNWERSDLVRISGQSSSVVSQWLGKGSKTIKSINKQEAAEALARASGFSSLWIAKGTGPQKPPAAENNQTPDWPFERITKEVWSSLDAAQRSRIEAMIEGAIGMGASPAIAPSPGAWKSTALQIAAGVDAVTKSDQFTRFVEAVDRSFSSTSKPSHN